MPHAWNLGVLPKFQVRSIAPGRDTTLVDGVFGETKAVRAGDPGWLFVSELESSIGEILTLERDHATIDVPNWAMTHHVHVGAELPWLHGYWQARDLAFLIDESKIWRRVKYRPSDAVVFAMSITSCTQCGWTGTGDTDLRLCPHCSGQLTQEEIFGNQEATFSLESDKRLVETRVGFWDHEHCLICNFRIDGDGWGYRESSFADGPNSVGIWFCEPCYYRYISHRDLSFLVEGLDER